MNVHVNLCSHSEFEYRRYVQCKDIDTNLNLGCCFCDVFSSYSSSHLGYLHLNHIDSSRSIDIELRHRHQSCKPLLKLRSLTSELLLHSHPPVKISTLIYPYLSNALSLSPPLNTYTKHVVPYSTHHILQFSQLRLPAISNQQQPKQWAAPSQNPSPSQPTAPQPPAHHKPPTTTPPYIQPVTGKSSSSFPLLLLFSTRIFAH
jgi:hypothetical protein